MVGVSLAIGDNVEDRLNWAKPQLALYIGGMGAKGKNFYHNVATKYGFGEVADRIHIHRLGKRLCVIDPKKHTMSDAVGFMTGAKPPPEEQALH
jgi:4-diphosphocytidyl-2C-methyl-D-erythritol kinase